MITATTGTRPVLHGLHRLGGWLDDRSVRDTTLLIDAGVAGGPMAAEVAEQLSAPGRRVHRVTLPDGGDIDSVLALGSRLRHTGLVVGVGGGSLLDQAKLAALVAADPKVAARLTVPQRSGLTVLPFEEGHSIPVVAVPTTVGTGAEVSAVACLRYTDAKRLVISPALRPAAAVLDPLATAGLPSHLLAEGVLEALFRAVSPYVGDHRDLPEADAALEVLAAQLVRLGDRVTGDLAAGRTATDADRQRIAVLSGWGHSPDLQRGRDPYAVKGWLVANELSSALGIRKMTAVAAILPRLWRAIGAGEGRLGSAARLDRMWTVVRSASGHDLPPDPSDGITALIGRWRIAHAIEADDTLLATVARQTVRRWGAGLPMLGGLGAAELRALLPTPA